MTAFSSILVNRINLKRNTPYLLDNELITPQISGAVSQYVVLDRANSDKWAIKIDDGEILIEITADAASAEPILEDTENSSDHWKIFVSEGQLGIEFTATVQDAPVILADATDGHSNHLKVSVDRQPPRSCRLEVEVVGNTVTSPATVHVFGEVVSAVNGYVVEDRTTADKWIIQVDGGQIVWSISAEPSSDDPVFQDTADEDVFWTIFIEDGQMGLETAGSQADSIILADISDGLNKRLFVTEGQLGAEAYSISEETFIFTQNGKKVGIVDFSAVAGITFSGLSDGFIKVRAINNMGQPVNQQVTVGSNIPVKFFRQRGKVVRKKQGQEFIAEFMMMAEEALDLRNSDMVYVVSGAVGLTLGEVDFVEKFFDFDGATHHAECAIFNP
jgi:hypothetical protein